MLGRRGGGGGGCTGDNFLICGGGGGGDLLFYRGEIENILLYWANPTHIPALWKSLGSIYRYQSK